ncbi:bacteriohemerythrin [Dongshaea marina]|uniref:bacteriohemerythrin n=1 Tax=Dongshaea marina TaxID=2047966 RepID=UPI000D3EA825|nr:bacteriohemerythrin [Dongshaea marina]
MHRLIQWDQASMGLDIELIDHQHQRLVEIINQLSELTEPENNDPVEFGIILGYIADYAYYHFQTEELYFDKYDYPDKEAHKAEHKYYIDKCKELISAYNKSNEDQQLAISLLTFLSDWLTHHICGSDRQFAPWLREHGLR